MENRKTKLILLCVLLTGCLLTSVAAEYFSKQEQAPVIKTETQTQSKEQLITVYVSGAVVRPGMYELPAGIRAREAVAAAGGFTDSANMEKVNLAKKLKDGSQVNVPALKVSRKAAGASAAPTGQQAVRPGRQQEEARGLVNINTASVAEFDSLPGVGEVTAQRIVEYRQQHPFARIEDIMQVRGIGEAKFNKMKDRLTVQ